MFVVRFAEKGAVFVDATPDLNAARNMLLFTLRNGLHTNKQLQAEWNTHGESAFHYQVLEKLDDDLEQMTWRDLLKDKRKEWVERMGALAITP
jgi:hypothetical protein